MMPSICTLLEGGEKFSLYFRMKCLFQIGVFSTIVLKGSEDFHSIETNHSASTKCHSQYFSLLYFNVA